MNDFLYIIIIIGLSILIVFYGGHNDQCKIEYDTKYFNNLNLIINFEKKINKILKKNIFENNSYVNINKYMNMTHILIPNFVNCFFIKINPYNVFNIYNIINKSDINTHMMIIFNHNKHNNIELIVDNIKLNLYDKNNYNINDQKEIFYFYDLKKIISITGLYHMYNDSKENIVITCFILKKPFWYI